MANISQTHVYSSTKSKSKKDLEVQQAHIFLTQLHLVSQDSFCFWNVFHTTHSNSNGYPLDKEMARVKVDSQKAWEAELSILPGMLHSLFSLSVVQSQVSSHSQQRLQLQPRQHRDSRLHYFSCSAHTEGLDDFRVLLWDLLWGYSLLTNRWLHTCKWWCCYLVTVQDFTNDNYSTRNSLWHIH